MEKTFHFKSIRSWKLACFTLVDIVQGFSCKNDYLELSITFELEGYSKQTINLITMFSNEEL